MKAWSATKLCTSHSVCAPTGPRKFWASGSIEQNEGAKFWLRVMNELKNRGVEDVLVAVVDGLKGFPDAITAVFPQASVQTCIVHLLRHSLDFVSWKDLKPVAAALKDIYRAVARATAFTLADTIAQQLRELGFDAVQSDEAGPEPDGRALIISGVFRGINEGHRRRFAAEDANVAASIEIASQTHGATPQRLTIFQLDSRQLPHPNGTHREPGVSSAVMRLAVMITHAVVELAHRSNWPGRRSDGG
jgi:hypothetical protein